MVFCFLEIQRDSVKRNYSIRYKSSTFYTQKGRPYILARPKNKKKTQPFVSFKQDNDRQVLHITAHTHTHPKLNIYSTCKMMVGRLLSFWDGKCSRAMLKTSRQCVALKTLWDNPSHRPCESHPSLLVLATDTNNPKLSARYVPLETTR